jgi:tetratricopeptide (TPR) repeat protein
MLLVEGKRAARKSTTNPDAFDSCMRGLWHFHQLTPEDNRQALTWLRRAIQLDPALAQAHAWLARAINAGFWYGWSQDPERELAEGLEAASRAVRLDDRDPYCHYALCLLSFLNRRYQPALAEAQRAVDVNPNFALGYFGLGWVRIYLGHFAEAIDPLLRSIRLNPNDPQAGMFMGIVALAHYHLRNYEEAAHYAERGLRGRRVYFVLRTYLATLGQLGRTDEASTIRAELLRMQPAYEKVHWSLTNPYAYAEHHAHLVEGLRKAGMNVETG